MGQQAAIREKSIEHTVRWGQNCMYRVVFLAVDMRDLAVHLLGKARPWQGIRNEEGIGMFLKL